MVWTYKIPNYTGTAFDVKTVNLTVAPVPNEATIIDGVYYVVAHIVNNEANTVLCMPFYFNPSV